MEFNECKSSRLIIELDGGLGNQIFQLVACKTLALSLNRKPSYSDIKCGKYRKFEVEKLAKFFGFERYVEYNPKTIPKLSEKDLCHPALFSEFSMNINSKQENILIYGTFASHRIHNKKIITDLRGFISKEINDIDFDFTNDFISVHLRELLGTWGDKPLNSIDNLNFLFYERAFKLISQDKSLNKIKKVLIFTDTFKNTKYSKLLPKLIKFLKKNEYEIIYGDKLCSATLDVLTLMSYAKCVIASNSTFSWWGAYLSNSKVISPIYSLWEPALTTPDEWIQINDGNINPRTWHGESGFENIDLKKVNDSYIRNKMPSFLPVILIKSLLKIQKILNYLYGKQRNKLWNLRFSSLLS